MLLNVELYLKENIDENITIKKRKIKDELPIFLKKSYNFYDIKIMNVECILLEMLEENIGIDMLEKHIKRIKELMNIQTVCYYKKISRHRRKSLIEKRIPFIIEDGQMFLPFLSLDMKKGYENANDGIKSFSVSAQIAYLFFLYNKDIVINTKEFAQKMGFNEMTASRALNELYNAKLIIYKIGGKTRRSKEYKKIEGPEYLKIGQLYLKTPVKSIVYVKNMVENSLIAGLDALAEISMINPPEYPIRAITYDELKKQNIEIIKNKEIAKDQNFIELEIWDYDPKLLTDNKYVDIMSLYISLKEEQDERVEQALEEVLRGEIWYMD